VVSKIDQKIELTAENAWSRESNVEIYLACAPESRQISEQESNLISQIIGNARRAEMDREIVRFDGDKILLVMSNIKRFLVLPK
jgi:hypothetical protein